MSNFTRPSKTTARRWVHRESTMKLSYCWVCGEEVVMQRHGRTKICSECRDSMTPEQIRDLVSRHYRHRSEQLNAKYARNKTIDRSKIFQSPFEVQ